MLLLNRSILTMVAAMTLASVAFADDAAEATSMVEKTVNYIKEQGKEKAFAKVNNPGGILQKVSCIFRDRYTRENACA